MKKHFIATAVLLSFLGGAFAQSVSLSNTFGGDSDNTKADDFLIFDKDFNKQAVSVGDRVQLDVASEKLDSRIRLDITNKLSLSGYVNLRPVEFLNFIGGNKFFSKWAIPSASLLANDNVVSYGKLADNDGAGVVLDIAGFKFSTAVAAESRLNLNFGLLYSQKDMFNVGFTAQDVTEKSVSFGWFAGLNSIKNLTLNAGYVYNYNDDSYLPATEHALQLSCSYSYGDSGFFIAGDVQLGLNNVKGDGSGDAYAQDGIPYYIALAASYAPLDNLNLNLKADVRHGLESDKDNNYVLYPYGEYKTSVGTFTLGVRTAFDTDGFAGLSIPFSWKYKLSKK
mgnify:FL=1